MSRGSTGNRAKQLPIPKNEDVAFIARNDSRYSDSQMLFYLLRESADGLRVMAIVAIIVAPLAGLLSVFVGWYFVRSDSGS